MAFIDPRSAKIWKWDLCPLVYNWLNILQEKNLKGNDFDDFMYIRDCDSVQLTL